VVWCLGLVVGISSDRRGEKETFVTRSSLGLSLKLHGIRSKRHCVALFISWKERVRRHSLGQAAGMV